MTLIPFVAYSTVLISLILQEIKSKYIVLIGYEIDENKAAKLFKLYNAEFT